MAVQPSPSPADLTLPPDEYTFADMLFGFMAFLICSEALSAIMAMRRSCGKHVVVFVLRLLTSTGPAWGNGAPLGGEEWLQCVTPVATMTTCQEQSYLD